MLEDFKLHIEKNFPFLQDSKLLIAISGGLDSVVLAHLCKQLGFNVALAHCNFNLRGKESDDDESFVENLAEVWDVEVFIQNFETTAYADFNKLSIQMAARELRYQWFDDLSLQLDFDYVLTAHHADDELETFIINLSRGTGLDGLKGIPEVNGIIVRPLLAFSRQVIEAYANDQDLKWREDSSNQSSKYLRNKIRMEVVPALKALDTNFLERFISTQDHLKESAQIVEDQMDEFADKVVTIKSNGMYLNISEIKATTAPKAYLYQLLKDFGFTDWQEIHELLDAQSGKKIFSQDYRLLKDRDQLILSRLNELESVEIFIPAGLNQIDTPVGNMTMELTDSPEDNSDDVIYVDADKINYPLILRQWQKGDVFFPIGMKGKKKLSKYFKDEKLSVLDKESTWLLCSGEDVIWIIGRRADDRFKLNQETKQILKISVHS